MPDVTCKICGVEFYHKNPRACLCSPECKRENKRNYWLDYHRKNYDPQKRKQRARRERDKKPRPQTGGFVVVEDPTGDYPKGADLVGFMDTLARNGNRDEQYIPWGTIVERKTTGTRYKVVGRKTVRV